MRPNDDGLSPGGGEEEVVRDLIDPVFRNGSTTVIGVVIGFSMGFLGNWALADGGWNAVDLVAVVLIVVGIAFQIRALSGMLRISSLVLVTYNRLIDAFLAGVRFTAVGVACAILSDVTGIGRIIPLKLF